MLMNVYDIWKAQLGQSEAAAGVQHGKDAICRKIHASGTYISTLPSPNTNHWALACQTAHLTLVASDASPILPKR